MKYMKPKEAIDYAPQWGSDASAADMSMYNLNDRGRPDDVEQRDLMLEAIDDAIPVAQKRIDDGTAVDDEKEDVEKLKALREYLADMTFPEPSEPYALTGEPEVGGHDVREFMTNYITAMLWSSHDESDDAGGEPFDSNYDESDIAPETMAEIEANARQFLGAVGHLITDANYIGRNTSGASILALAGHDAWLTQVGHGAGFWDGDWASDEHTGSREGPMSAAAKALGEFVSPMVGDDGRIHLS